jgi:hypothetical protein
MKNLIRKVEFIANNTNEAIELKDKLIEQGLDVTHIYTGSSIPILLDKDNKNYTVGAGNIRMNYLTGKK